MMKSSNKCFFVVFFILGLAFNIGSISENGDDNLDLTGAYKMISKISYKDDNECSTTTPSDYKIYIEFTQSSYKFYMLYTPESGMHSCLEDFETAYTIDDNYIVYENVEIDELIYDDSSNFGKYELSGDTITIYHGLIGGCQEKTIFNKISEVEFQNAIDVCDYDENYSIDGFWQLNFVADCKETLTNMKESFVKISQGKAIPYDCFGSGCIYCSDDKIVERANEENIIINGATLTLIVRGTCERTYYYEKASASHTEKLEGAIEDCSIY